MNNRAATVYQYATAYRTYLISGFFYKTRTDSKNDSSKRRFTCQNCGPYPNLKLNLR